MSSGEEKREVHLNIKLPDEQMGGVWSNFARVHHSEHEFTIDFMRLDFASISPEGEMQGIVVTRVGLSPLFVRQLIAALEENWSKYAKKAMPREVYGDDSDDHSS
jgi:Protein of unknown function (DUF3467)